MEKKLNMNLRKDMIKKFLVHPISVKDISSIKTLMLAKYCGVYLVLKVYLRQIGKKEKKQSFPFKATFSSLC